MQVSLSRVRLAKYWLKQLNGTFHFVLILAVPVDKGGSVSPNIGLHVPSADLEAGIKNNY